MNRLLRRIAVSGMTLALLAASVACGPSEIDQFCDRVAELQAAGPLFPARTDGEPVPDPDVIEAIEAMAAAAPSDIAEEAEVLADEARALVAEAESRRTNQSHSATTDRWSPSAVEQAQIAVISYADTECGLDLTYVSRG